MYAIQVVGLSTSFKKSTSILGPIFLLAGEVKACGKMRVITAVVR
jgi:hypothetical protein